MPHRKNTRKKMKSSEILLLRFKTTSILIAPSCHAHSPKNTFWLSCLLKRRRTARSKHFLRIFILWSLKCQVEVHSPQIRSSQKISKFQALKLFESTFFGSNNRSVGKSWNQCNHLRLLINKHKRN